MSRATRVTDTGAGLQFSDPGFRALGKLILLILFRLPASLRESIFFTSSPICLPLQKALQRSLGGPRKVLVRFTEGPLQGFTFECWSSEKYFMLGANFELPVQVALKENVNPGDIVYDIGANVGYMSLLFSGLCGTSGHVFAFEPSPLNFQRLQRHVELNRLDNITVVNRAASDFEGDGALAEQGSESHLVAGQGAPAQECSHVSVIRLDDYVFRDGHAPPALVKIDVEGHAGYVLGGMAGLLEHVRPKVILEIHHDREDSAVSSLLSCRGYETSDIDRTKGFPKSVMAVPLARAVGTELVPADNRPQNPSR